MNKLTGKIEEAYRRTTVDTFHRFSPSQSLSLFSPSLHPLLSIHSSLLTLCSLSFLYSLLSHSLSLFVLSPVVIISGGGCKHIGDRHHHQQQQQTTTASSSLAADSSRPGLADSCGSFHPRCDVGEISKTDTFNLLKPLTADTSNWHPLVPTSATFVRVSLQHAVPRDCLTPGTPPSANHKHTFNLFVCSQTKTASPSRAPSPFNQSSCSLFPRSLH